MFAFRNIVATSPALLCPPGNGTANKPTDTRTEQYLLTFMNNIKTLTSLLTECSGITKPSIVQIKTNLSFDFPGFLY